MLTNGAIKLTLIAKKPKRFTYSNVHVIDIGDALNGNRW